MSGSGQQPTSARIKAMSVVSSLERKSLSRLWAAEQSSIDCRPTGIVVFASPGMERFTANLALEATGGSHGNTLLRSPVTRTALRTAKQDQYFGSLIHS